MHRESSWSTLQENIYKPNNMDMGETKNLLNVDDIKNIKLQKRKDECCKSRDRLEYNLENNEDIFTEQDENNDINVKKDIASY